MDLLKQALRTTDKHIEKLKELGINNIDSLAKFFPREIEYVGIISSFSEISLGNKNTITGKITDIHTEISPKSKKLLAKASLELKDGVILSAVWFVVPHIFKVLKTGSTVFLVGKISRNFGLLQIVNPEIHLSKNVHIDGLRVIYSESPPITSKWLREKLAKILPQKKFKEILPAEIIKQEKFLSRDEAIKKIHFPKNTKDWELARERLAFEEVFVSQVHSFFNKFQNSREKNNRFNIPLDIDSVKKNLQSLPFELTNAQKQTLYIILKDFTKPAPAQRLIQGDTGSGKTIVAFLAIAEILKHNYQAAILAPTEILAQQHHKSAKNFLAKFSSPIDKKKIVLLSGSLTEKNKQEIRENLRLGKIDLIIGTHAILTENTEFKNLALAIIDEQHRFGVNQRAVLSSSGCHTISMTATPIPRSLALTIYGDQDISVINELPPGRQIVHTRVVADKRTRDLCEKFIDDQITKQGQVFWICPLIDESDKIELRHVAGEFDRISREIFPTRRVEFLHGKMTPKEKTVVMEKFKNHEIDILVSTSVVEVGVDIPNATVMVIENSERFGLSQLHQFRGRIGRNKKKCYCFLMVDKTEHKHKLRLKAMEQTSDGLKLAEIDLKIRGMGEIYGTRQSGIPNFKIANLSDTTLLQKSRDWAKRILKQDISLRQFPELLKEISSKEILF